MKVFFEDERDERTMLELLRESISHCDEQDRPIAYIELSESEWERMRSEHNAAYRYPYLDPEETWCMYYGVRLQKKV
jgi:hypothetical protein